MKTTTWKTKCKCGEDVYYHPQKLLLETHTQPEVDMSRRIVSLTCCSDCKRTIDYEFPKQFEQIF
jgi:hypothetical protein